MSQPTATTTSVAEDLSLFKQALAATRGALIITDSNQADNPIIYANKAFCTLTGYKESEILGRNCRFLQGADTDPESVTSLREAVKAEREERVVIQNYRKDGTPFWNDLLMSPVKDKRGKLTHFIGMQLDITERVNYEHQLEDNQERLRRSNQELEQFTYAASHDLQEPLRMVRSFLELIEKRYQDKLDDDGRSFITYAVDGATRMQSLISDLLRLSRVRTTAKPVKSVKLARALETALLNLKVRIEELSAEITYDKKLPTICADESQLVQLLQNLIGNALKYHQPDVKPKITISCARQKGFYEIAVADNGIGIEQQYYERIFNVFQRLHTREEYEGTGVGLTICQKIVERHGGRIWVESKPNQGATFYFTLPIPGAKRG